MCVCVCEFLVGSRVVCVCRCGGLCGVCVVCLCCWVRIGLCIVLSFYFSNVCVCVCVCVCDLSERSLSLSLLSLLLPSPRSLLLSPLLSFSYERPVLSLKSMCDDMKAIVCGRWRWRWVVAGRGGGEMGDG